MIEYILEATVRYATPLLLVALGEIIAETCRGHQYRVGRHDDFGGIHRLARLILHPKYKPWACPVVRHPIRWIEWCAFSRYLWFLGPVAKDRSGGDRHRHQSIGVWTCRGIVPPHLWRDRGRTESGNLSNRFIFRCCPVFPLSVPSCFNKISWSTLHFLPFLPSIFICFTPTTVSPSKPAVNTQRQRIRLGSACSGCRRDVSSLAVSWRGWLVGISRW